MDSNLLLVITKNELQEMLKDIVQSSIVTNTVVDSPSISTSTKFLTINDMCEMFGVSRVTIGSWMKTGKLPFKKIRRRVFFLLNEVLESIPSFDMKSVHSFQKSLQKGGKI
jgi:predicted DNA-binding transcriptional regulator AlpA